MPLPTGYILDPQSIPSSVKNLSQFPLSFAQQRLWFLAQMEGASEAYNVPFGLRLKGRLDRGALRQALDRILFRHEALRTTFVSIEGEPVQRIAAAKDSRFLLLEHDLYGSSHAQKELERLLALEASGPFDLEHDPLIRGRLIYLAEDEHVLLITMHHIVSDGWSMGILVNELSALYGSFLRGAADPLPALEIQYADYAVWQREWIESEMLQEQAAYWKTALAGVPPLLELPADRPRPAQQDFKGATVELVLDEKLTAGLRALSKKHGATLYMTLLAAWAVLAARLSGQQDVVIGTPVANRSRVEIEGLIGFFVNTLAIRLDLFGSPAVGELLQRTRTQTLAAQQHEDIPFEQVVELLQPARRLAHSPIFQITFAWQNNEQCVLELPGLEVQTLNSAPHRVAKYDFALDLHDEGQVISGVVVYATSLFERETVERYLGYFRNLLEGMVADDTQLIGRLPLLAASERHQVLYEWNATEAAYPSEKCVHQLFEEQVEKSPQAVAVEFEEESLSYAELNRRANQMAHCLRAQGVKSDSRVAVCVERGLELVIGLLGILKAGAAYVPLDPAYPEERLRFMVEDSEPVVVLTQSHLRELLPQPDRLVPVLDLDDAAAPWLNEAESNPDPAEIGLSSHHLAYVIYTSGSTGKPKGVMVLQSGVLNLVTAAVAKFEVGPEARVLQLSSSGFDASLMEMLMTWAAGGVLVIPRPGPVVGESLLEVLYEKHVSHAVIPPSVLNSLNADRPLNNLRMLIVGAEACTPDLVERWAEGRRMVNAYGPTEATICTTVSEPLQPKKKIHIGRPITNTRMYILDGHGEPVPVGVAGELYIGGAGVARGYLNRAELTAERFLEDPFAGEPGARMYRTGDLGRWLPDGNIEFLGRNDYQVKIRGFRIELGEIEARLLEHGGVKGAVVLAREDTPGEKRLVAYYTVADTNGEALGAEQLRTHLSGMLPEYMVPAAYVRLESLPLTPNGKLDRKALPAPDGDAYGTGEYEPPVGETEVLLAKIWADLFQLDRVGRHDDFFSLGGHSLLAVQMVTRLPQMIGVEDLFTHPVLSDLARFLSGVSEGVLPPISRANRGERLPLSFAQQRLWFLGQMKEGSEAYHIPSGIRLKGDLDVAALERALNRIVQRHEALRTSFELIEGEPVQQIAAAEESRFFLRKHDLSQHAAAQDELKGLAEQEAGASFDLETGPLVRGRLVRVAEEEHVLLVTMHHIVSDGWSVRVLVNELSALYGSFLRGAADPLPALEIQYADYAVWQRQWVEGDVLRRQMEYWKEALEGAPAVLELPTDHVRPAQQDFRGAFAELVLDEELTEGLRKLSRRHGATLYMTLLAAWAALLARLSGQQDLVIGTPVANRNRVEIEGLIGFFVNTLAIRLDLTDSLRVGELLNQVKERFLAAQAHQDIPFEQVVELMRPVRSLSHSPLIQAMFAWQSTPQTGLQLRGLELSFLPPAHAVARFDLVLALEDQGRVLSGRVEYATSLFERETIDRWLGYFRNLLEAMVADDTQLIGRLPVLAASERRQVLYEWNATQTEYPSERCVHELFEEQVEKSPQAVAVEFEKESLSYGDLNRRANQVAHYLRAHGVKPDSRVAICVERSLELVIGLLGILKAGGAYVPLDPAYPEDRLRFMVEDSEPVALLTQSYLSGLFRGLEAKVPVLELDDAAAPWLHEAESNLDPAEIGLNSDHLSYVIYTSGSTGTPKGVMVEHRQIVSRLSGIQESLSFCGKDTMPNVSSIAFDISLLELLLPLVSGGQTVLTDASEIKDMGYLVERTRSATVFNAVTSLMDVWHQHLLGEDVGVLYPQLRALLVGGEPVSQRLLDELSTQFPGVEIVETYGPTESALYCTSCSRYAGGGGASSPPIGRPLANTRIYILDGHGQPVPIGVAGELYIGGAGVARGYLNRTELTAERFLRDPFAGEPEARMYRTGDLGRWLPDGNIEFLGRNDYQVKIRGFRIELGEIEARLLEHSEVKGAVVLAREDTPGEKRLVAYYTVADGEEALDAEQLRTHLSGLLPEYMVPAAYVRLESMPLTPNGKLDRQGLPAPEQSAYSVSSYEAPQGETEVLLAEIWAELLKLDRVGRHDNFFSLGGHSLLAVTLIERMRRSGFEVDVRAVFAAPTVAGLAAGKIEEIRL